MSLTYHVRVLIQLLDHPMMFLRRPSRPLTAMVGAAALALLPSCVSHSVATEFHGVAGIRGVPVEYQTTTAWALHGLFIFPLIGDARKATVIDAFTEEAAAQGASRQRITQTSSFTYWFILPPISFFIHPVTSTIEGDIELQ
ncbi:MAG: hypothetical protein ACI80K_002384 [Paracoccaceae bacterium]